MKESKKSSEEVQKTDLPICFVLMPLSDPDGYTQGHFKRVYEDILKPACELAGYKAIRGDEVYQTNLIHLDILQKLLDVPMALCDLSNRNPNAMFELGIRQAFDKPVVLVQEVGTKPIFDIAPLRYTEYRNKRIYDEVVEDQQRIAESLKDTQKEFDSGLGINSIVRLLGLTHSATLKNVHNPDKDELLQLLRAEVNALRQEFRDSVSLINSTIQNSSSNQIQPKYQSARRQFIESTRLSKLPDMPKYSQTFENQNSNEDSDVEDNIPVSDDDIPF